MDHKGHTCTLTKAPKKVPAGTHCIIQPKLMTPYQLQMETWKNMLRFYSKKTPWELGRKEIRANLFPFVRLLTEFRFMRNLPKAIRLWLT